MSGRVVCRSRTDATGAYQFDAALCGLTAASESLVSVVVGRKQFVTPFLQRASGTSVSVPAFQLRGVPATLAFSGCQAGALVLVTPLPYAGTDAPSLSRGSSSLAAYSSVADSNGKVTMSVPAQRPIDVPYSVTTWSPTVTNGVAVYGRATGTAPARVAPTQTITMGCPL